MDSYLQPLPLTSKESKLKYFLLGTMIKRSRNSFTCPNLSLINSIKAIRTRHRSLDVNPVLREMLEETIDKEILYIHKHEAITIPFKNKWKQLFDAFISIFILVDLIGTLYFLAFQKINAIEMDFDNLLWALFIIDFIVGFFSQYIDEKKRPIKNLKLIFIHYAKGMMFPNLIALVPLRFFGSANTECFLRLFRLLRVSRVYELVEISKISEFVAGWFYPEVSLKKKRLKLEFDNILESLKSLLKIFFGTYVVACLSYYTIDFLRYHTNEKHNFIKDFNLEHDNIANRMIKTWYFIFSTLTTVGYGDFYATNKYEMMFAIILLVSGPTWFAFMAGKAINMINSLRNLEKNNYDQKGLQGFINIIETLYKPLTVDLKERIFSHYYYLWRHDRLGTLYNKSQEDNFCLRQNSDLFFEALPIDAQREILDYLFSDIFSNFKVFMNSVELAKYDFCRFLQPRQYQNASIIIPHDLLVQELFFFESGKCKISIYRSSKRIQICNITTKSVLGDYFVFKKVPSYLEYSAVGLVKGFSLETFAFYEISKRHNLDLSKYENKVIELYRKLDIKIGKSLKNIALDETDRELIFFDSFMRKLSCEMQAVEEESNLVNETDYNSEPEDWVINRKNFMFMVLKGKLAEYLKQKITLK